MSPTQTETGKAFEFCVAKAISKVTKTEIEENRNRGKQFA